MKISVVQAIMWALGAYFFTSIAFLLAVSVSPGIEHDQVPLAAIQCAVYLTLCSVFAGRRPGRTWSETFAMRRTSVWLVLFAFVLGAAACLPALALAELVDKVFPMDQATREALEGWSPKRSLGRDIALFLFAGAIGPLAEELLFRGALYTGLRPGHTPAYAGWTTAILFTLSHLLPQLWPSILLLGLLMASVRAVSGSLWPSVFLHGAFNATALSMPLVPFLKDPSLALVLSCIPLSAALAGAIFWIGRSSSSADRARRVDLEPDPGIGETAP